MLERPHCAHQLSREHRGPLQRLIYKELYECKHCHRQVGRLYPTLSGTLGFIFSTRTLCVKCGNERVQRRIKKDRADLVSRHPLSLLFGLTGAPIYRCPTCRIQYRDWRRTSRIDTNGES